MSCFPYDYHIKLHAALFCTFYERAAEAFVLFANPWLFKLSLLYYAWEYMPVTALVIWYLYVKKGWICCDYGWHPIQAWLYYDGNWKMAWFATASFANSVGKRCKILWQSKVFHVANEVLSSRASPGYLFWFVTRKEFWHH